MTEPENQNVRRGACLSGRLKPLLNTAIAVISCILLVWILSAAMPADPGTLSDSAGKAGFIQDTETLDICIVYSDRDSWGAGEAQRLSELMQEKFSVECTVTGDGEYAKLDSIDRQYGLTVSLGHTILSPETYLEAHSRLGYSGLEISASSDVSTGSDEVNGGIKESSASSAALPEILYITAFTHEKVREGADLFIENFISNGTLYHIISRLYTTDAPEAGMMSACLSVPVTADADKDSVNVLTVTAPGDDDCSLFNFACMLDEAAPSLVVFNGGLDCGARDRAELASAWSAVSSLLGMRSVPWCCTFSADEKLPRELLAEVIFSFDGCLNDPSSADTTLCAVLLNDKKPVLSVFIADAADAADADGINRLCDAADACTSLLTRAGGCGFAAVLPFLPQSAAENISAGTGFTVNEELTPYIHTNCKDLYDTLTVTEGADFMICRAGNTNTGASCVGDMRLLLTGSLDFDSPGLGGRFDFNNSQRCGAVISAVPRRGGSAEFSCRMITAAELGTNHK